MLISILILKVAQLQSSRELRLYENQEITLLFSTFLKSENRLSENEFSLVHREKTKKRLKLHNELIFILNQWNRLKLERSSMQPSTPKIII